MAKRTPTVQLRKPPVDVDRFVAAQEPIAQTHKRIGAKAQKRTGAQAQERTGAQAQERTRLHCIIPADLHQWLAMEAVLQKKDMGEIVVDALERVRAAK